MNERLYVAVKSGIHDYKIMMFDPIFRASYKKNGQEKKLKSE